MNSIHLQGPRETEMSYYVCGVQNKAWSTVRPPKCNYHNQKSLNKGFSAPPLGWALETQQTPIPVSMDCIV